MAKHVEGKNTTVKPHYLQPHGDLAANAHMFLNVPGSAAVSTEGNVSERPSLAFDPHPLSSLIDQIRDTKTVPLPVVGRCKDCKHWRKGVAGVTGHCLAKFTNAADVGIPSLTEFNDPIVCGKNFGCVRFEAKGEA